MLHPQSWASAEESYCEVKLSRNSIINFKMPIDHDAEEDFLSQRAWCFQEKMLSPRVLFFGSTQMTYTFSKRQLTEENYVRETREKRDMISGKNELHFKVARVLLHIGV
jgi:hypothetical protein